MPRADVLVLGAGIVGISTALALQKRGIATILTDRNTPAMGASFGNSGVIQREAVLPYAMPRDVGTLVSTLLGNNVAARLHYSALPDLLPFLARYWWYSSKKRHRSLARSYATLIERCLDAYEAAISGTNADLLISRQGIYSGFRAPDRFAIGCAEAEFAAKTYGIDISVTETKQQVEDAIPHIRDGFCGLIHFRDSVTVSDPHMLAKALFRKFEDLGGIFQRADAEQMKLVAGRYELTCDGHTFSTEHAVIALGADAPLITRRFGLNVPMGIKRGYHVHFKPQHDKPLLATFVDEEYGYVLTPKSTGIRMTTGAEFARIDTPPTPHQIHQAQPIARALFPMGSRIEDTPWMGIRPCMPDMLPMIGEMPSQMKLWCAFGHGHQGLTLGPVTGEIIADEIEGKAASVDLAPFSPSRFSGKLAR